MNLRLICLVFFLSFGGFVTAQLQDLKGRIIAANDVEGIHILNRTSVKYAISDQNGDFDIPVKLSDTITVTGLAYKTQNLIITKEILKKDIFKIYLEINIDDLEQVTVGKILTGNIDSDIRNTKVKTPINFYDLGIPGYTGKQKTLNERKLASTSSGGGLIPLVGLINAITGRTKELKENIKLDKKIACVERFKNNYKSMIFETEKLSDTFQDRFFNFIFDSEKLDSACYSGSAFKTIEFLKAELILYKQSLTSDDKKD